MTITEKHKRVFILGAGFSKSAGMPDACELTDLLLSRGLGRYSADFTDWAESMRSRIAHLNRNTTSPRLNIEQLFECAELDRKLCLMEQQLCKVGRRDGVTPFEQADDIDTWLRYMEQDLVELLITKQDNADLDTLRSFARNLRTDDTVLTFNYDTLLEQSLSDMNRSWSHGFPTETSGDVEVLKLHGSLDWWMIPRGRSFPAGTFLYSKGNCNENEPTSLEEWGRLDPEERYDLYRAPSLSVALELDDQSTGLSNGRPPRPGLGGLGPQKLLEELVGSGHVWPKAFGALRNADEIIIVGWSCSPYDMMARFHFASAVALRKSPLSLVRVVDPNAKKIAGELASIFHSVEPISSRAEKVDWASF